MKFKYNINITTAQTLLKLESVALIDFFLFFYKNAQKKSVTLWYRDKNDRISMEIVYKKYYVIEYYNSNFFMENCVSKICIWKLFYNLCEPHDIFLVYYQMEFSSIFKYRLL